MARPRESPARRPRICIDVGPEMRRRLHLAAAKCGLTVRQYALEAMEDWLRKDQGDCAKGMLALTAKADPVLAELWDNRRDAEYNRQYSVLTREDQVIQ